VHHDVRVKTRESEGQQQLARYLVRAPVDADCVRSARAAWARLIQKVHQADPMLCPHCGAEMRLMARIEDPVVIRKIRDHFDHNNAPQETGLFPEGRAPPAGLFG
jgi:hypothetical protein